MCVSQNQQQLTINNSGKAPEATRRMIETKTKSIPNRKRGVRNRQQQQEQKKANARSSKEKKNEQKQRKGKNNHKQQRTNSK